MDFDELMEKVDYLVRMNPKIVHLPLSQVGQPRFTPAHKLLSKEEARKDLLKLGAEEIEKRYNEELSRQREQNEREEKKRFFHKPYCDADFNYFGRKALWSLEEGITLILGKDPRKVKWDDIQGYLHCSPLVKKFAEMKELALSYKNAGQLSDPVAPGMFLVWAGRMKFDTPEKLQQIVCELDVPAPDWQTLCVKAIGIMEEKNNIIEVLENEIDQLKIDMEEISKQNLSPRSEETYLTILGCILETMFRMTSGNQKLSCFENQSTLIEYLVQHFSSSRGISKSTLEEKFAMAKKKIKSS